MRWQWTAAELRSRASKVLSVNRTLAQKGKPINLAKATALVLFFFATTLPVYTGDFLCFESVEDCKEKGALIFPEALILLTKSNT